MAENIIVDRRITNPSLSEHLAVRRTMMENKVSDQKSVTENLENIAREIVEKSTFLVPAEIAGEPVKEKDGSLSVPASVNITFVIFSLDTGKKYLPVFSDMEQVEKWNGKADNVRMFTMDFEHIANILQQMDEDVGMVLNPYTDNLMMKRAMVLKWYETLQISKNGHANHAIPVEMAGSAYALNPYPFQLSNVVCEAAKGVPSINALWLRGIKFNDEHSYLLVVDFTGDRQAAFAPLGEAAKKFIGSKPLHIVQRDDGFGGKVVEGITPIYTKQ